VKIVPALTVTGSFGIGAQSIDAPQVIQDQLTPFSKVTAGEGGLLYHERLSRPESPSGDGEEDDWLPLRPVDINIRLIGYYTYVDHDLIFDPSLGRLSPTGGTRRRGGVMALRIVGPWFDEAASATYAYATYGDGTLVPYVPNLVIRSDTAVFKRLPWQLIDRPVTVRAGVGLNFVGERALPLGQVASPTFVLDASAKIRWSFFELGIIGQNLLNAQYPLSEFFYASYWQHPGQMYPTLTPVEHFTAAPPLTILATLSILFDKESMR
jgi:hypothetical protein